mmetsp:Transcript_27668/g.77362  ORF Transcript_27668/g.77362 Transcript_27668/m.77362 type:complete len:227 (-) Transcript_27668:119-799(-)
MGAASGCPSCRSSCRSSCSRKARRISALCSPHLSRLRRLSPCCGSSTAWLPHRAAPPTSAPLQGTGSDRLVPPLPPRAPAAWAACPAGMGRGQPLRGSPPPPAPSGAGAPLPGEPASASSLRRLPAAASLAPAAAPPSPPGAPACGAPGPRGRRPLPPSRPSGRGRARGRPSASLCGRPRRASLPGRRGPGRGAPGPPGGAGAPPPPPPRCRPPAPPRPPGAPGAP